MFDEDWQNDLSDLLTNKADEVDGATEGNADPEAVC